MMSTTVQKPATTPIPVQLSEPEFEAFILPHLSMPKRGPKCKLGYYRVFNGLPTASPKMDIFNPPVPRVSQGASALRRTRIGFPCSLKSIAQSPLTTSVSRRWYETDKPVVLTQ
jgi:hypothetical protein